MRLSGHKSTPELRGISLALFMLSIAGMISQAGAQTAPYILPYTMSTFAGPVASLTIGQKCGNYVSLDAVGDGCPALYVSVGSDPHDIRVDAKGNVYWIDNSSKVVIHKISATTGLETVFAGSAVQTKACATAADKYGDGCVSTDGVANSGTALFYTGSLAKSRGLGIAPNGDVLLADYGGNEDHRISAATGVMILLAGTGSTGDTDGPVGSSTVNGTRGIGEDANGNVYIADTGNDVIRMVNTSLVSSTITAQYAGAVGLGSGGCPAVRVINSTPVPASQAYVCAPEDVQVDVYGNIFIADAGDNLVRAIYGGGGPFFGIVNPIKGDMYTIAGFNVYAGGPATATAYPTGGSQPTVVANTVSMGIRKIGLDNRGNLYIADATGNVIWFVDVNTGYVRLLAGVVGATAGATPTPCATATDTLNDGCPGPLAAIYSSAGADAANSPDNQGNLYLTDSEGASAAKARLRKLLSGLNFPTVATGSSVTQTILVYFGPLDTQAATGAFTSSNTDFVVGTSSCTVNADTTSVCTIPVTYTPTKPGYETSTLTIKSTLGGVSSALLTGTGTVSAVVIDPGTTTLLNTLSATKNAQGVVFDGAGNAYIADTGNNRVLFYNALTATTTVFAGTGTAGYTGDSGLAAAATLNGPKAVTLDTSGSVYIADSGNNVIRKVNAAGVITTFAGKGTACALATNTRGDGCPATQATFSNPSGLTADNLGQIYVSDTGNNVIRQINVLGYVTTLAGGAATVCTAYTDTFGDGCAASQTIFNGPTGLAYDATGNAILVADTGNSVIRRIAIPIGFTYSGTGTSTLASNIEVNPVTLVAGNGQAGSSVDSGLSAIKSQLNLPTGVAVDAGENVYVADTANGSVRLVNYSTGLISTIVGITGTPGTGTLGSATTTELSSPGGVAVLPIGAIYVADSSNNRVVVDSRSQVSYNFGRTNIGFPSPVQNFTETSIGTATATLAAASTQLYTATGTGGTQFTLTAPTGSTGCPTSSSSPITLAPGASCVLQGQFTPTATGTFSEAYTETGATTVAGGLPSITLSGVGAVLTTTTSTVAQTTPAAGTNSQYGGSVTLTATVSAVCNAAAPSCSPTGTVRIVVDGVAGGPITLSSALPPTASQTITGLSVGPHTISCNYSGDNYYAASSCPSVTITVAQAATTSLLTVSNNNMPQFTPVTLTATVLSNTSGIPQGTVTFYANGNPLGTPGSYAQALTPAGVATLLLSRTLDMNDNLVTDLTLPPGSYTLTCTYSGSSNFALSNCAPVTFTVVPDVPNFTLVPRGCSYINLWEQGTTIPGKGVGCATGAEIISNGVPTIGTAQGSTTDATIFINVTNTVAGTLTFSCSGLPAASTCTFSPTSITLTASTGTVSPVYTDVTMWTDLQPGYATSSLRRPSIGDGKNGTTLAIIAGGPMALLGMVGILWLRRKKGGLRGLTLVALLMVMCGSTLMLSSCAGPGLYTPVFTPAGTYPVTVTVKGDGITASTIVNFKVSAPGIPGQE